MSSFNQIFLNPESRKETFDCLNQLMWEFRVEPPGSNNFRFLWFSEEYGRMVGVGHDEMAGKPIKDVLSTDDYAKVRARYWECVQAKEQIYYPEYLNIGSPNTDVYRWWKTTLRPTLFVDGKVARILGSSEKIDTLESQLRTAIDEQSLAVHYQPIYRLVSRPYLAGYEALIRWPGSEYTPGDFLPVAKSVGIMPRITDFVIDAAGQALSRIPEKQWIAVNISNCPFSQKLQQTTERYGIDPRRLRFEITEDTQLIPDVLERLKSTALLGHPLEIDDFGTENANLNWIGRLGTVEAIKLDQQFVTGAAENENQRAICAAAVSLALNHTPQLKIIAEGIETEEDLAFATEMQICYGQGWLFGKAMPLEEILRNQWQVNVD